MNIHNTSRPTISAPDELVPSRYAVKVGDIDVLVVSDGVLPLPTKMLGHNADPAVRAAWMNDIARRGPRLSIPLDHVDRIQRSFAPQSWCWHRAVQHGAPTRRPAGRRGAPDADQSPGRFQ